MGVWEVPVRCHRSPTTISCSEKIPFLSWATKLFFPSKDGCTTSGSSPEVICHLTHWTVLTTSENFQTLGQRQLVTSLCTPSDGLETNLLFASPALFQNLELSKFSNPFISHKGWPQKDSFLRRFKKRYGEVPHRVSGMETSQGKPMTL